MRGRRRQCARRAFPPAAMGASMGEKKSERGTKEREWWVGFVSLATIRGKKRPFAHVLACPWRRKVSANLVEVWVVPNHANRPFCIWVRLLGAGFTQTDITDFLGLGAPVGDALARSTSYVTAPMGGTTKCPLMFTVELAHLQAPLAALYGYSVAVLHDRRWPVHVILWKKSRKYWCHPSTGTMTSPPMIQKNPYTVPYEQNNVNNQFVCWCQDIC
jgi:hypothetical protein